MSLVSSHHSFTANPLSSSTSTSSSISNSTKTSTSTSTSTSINSAPAAKPSSADSSDAVLSALLGAYTHEELPPPMERGAAAEYTQSGLPTPYPSAFTDPQSEEAPAVHASAAHYPPQLEARPNHNTSTSSTPSSSDYAGVYPLSARSASFPAHVQAQFHSSTTPNGSSGGMAQPPSPSQSLQDGRPNHQSPQIKSDQEVPIDPSISAASPTYPPHGGPYSPYPPQQEMQHGYPPHPAGAMYSQPRPDWAGYAGHPQHPLQGGYAVTGAQTPTSAASAGARPGQHHLSQVYSFVPIPGAQQHKRPRRRYEEIERMYKCGWNGCEKAYGTLNHLNAHVTMQSHGSKRTPEEFKEIRKEWKARKKEEDSLRKAEDERARAAVAPGDGQPGDVPSATAYQQAGRNVQLPPISYQPGSQVPSQYQAPPSNVQQLQEYSGHALQYAGYPASPYGTQNPYNQANGSTAPKYEQ